jgi:hypothetical protein
MFGRALKRITVRDQYDLHRWSIRMCCQMTVMAAFVAVEGECEACRIRDAVVLLLKFKTSIRPRLV